MTNIIPRDKIRHLEWKPGDEVVKIVQTPNKIIISNGSNKFSIDDLINHGQEFYSDEKNEDGLYIGVAKALEEAVNTIGENGIIASMPYHIAGKAKADKENYLWKKWFTCLSEENVGIDKSGLYVGKGKPIIVTVHGGGILTPERIMQAYKEGLTDQNAAKYTDNEFNDLLKGKLPSGENIELYSVNDVLKGNISDPFGKYAVWMDFEDAKKTESGYYKKDGFVKNPLVLCRTGTQNYLENYFDKAMDSNKEVRNSHRLNDVNYTQPQGRVLFLSNKYIGLDGDYNLNNDGRFIGVRERSS